MGLAVLLTALGLAPAQAAPVPWMTQPAPSPDGTQIAFVSAGDIWAVASAGGEARLLVAHPAEERRPLFSPDGTRLAFVSDRTGNGDIYVLDLATGELSRITFDDGFEDLSAWSADGEWLYYSSSTADVSGMSDVYRVSARGGTPEVVSGERYTNEFHAAPAPDGASLLLVARGIGNSQWWRRGHSHIDESEIWQRDRAGAYRPIVSRGAKSLWPMWAANGRGFFFVSDRTGSENIWSSSLDGSAAPLTEFRDGRVLWPQAARDGGSIVFERDFGLWRYDVAAHEARPITVSLRGAPAGKAPEMRELKGGFSELSVSPDGKKVAFVARGEVFAASAEDGGEAFRVTDSEREEFGIAWAPDSRSIVYASAREGAEGIYRYDFGRGREERLAEGAGADSGPRFSPDGKSIAWIRAAHEVRVLDLATRAERSVASGVLGLQPPLGDPNTFAWSPDSRWVAYLATGDRLFCNAAVVEAAKSGAQPVPVSFLANTFCGSLSWSADARSLYFVTSQRTEQGQVARVDLAPRPAKFKEEKFRELFADDAKAAGSADKPEAKSSAAKKSEEPAKTELVVDGIRRRLRLLPVGIDVESATLDGKGERLLLVGSAEGASNLYVYSLDELADEPAVAEQLSSSAAGKASAQWSGDGKTVWYLEDGSIHSLTVDDKKDKSLAVTARMEVAFERDRLAVFDQAWTWLDRFFHDSTMNGVDWRAVRERFRPRIEAARVPSELYRLLSMMVGELNASHLGVYGPGDPARTTGRIGLRFGPAGERGLPIVGVVPNSPAAIARTIAPGETLTAVDGRALGPHVAVEQLLENRIGRETRLTIGAAGGGKTFDVTVRPITQAAEKALLYDEWIEKNRAYVERLSGGRLGYVHMPSMGYDSLLRVIAELDAANMSREGVVFDIRNNNGGFVNAYALDILTRRHYLAMTFRGWPRGSARSLLGQRALERPTVLVTNQHSLSDAEDFSEGYRALGLGQIVGEPTAGWIIYTTNQDMLDGSTVRLPFITITTAGGEPMEMHPRPVDVAVSRALGEDAQGKDSQLERAVAVLLGQLDEAKTPKPAAE
jgi:Tol biopolymer transport system component/C-terminal processing protease CtpA/Prc